MKKTAQFKKYNLVKQFLGNFRGLRFAHAMRVPRKVIFAALKHFG